MASILSKPRPEPDWDLVWKRNSIERLKREKFPLDVRDELPELIARGYEAVSEEDIVRLNWWGLTHDKPKVGTFMVRIKVPGGLVPPARLRAVGRIARTYGRDEIELTTRQGVQLHWVRLDQLPEVLAEIEAAGLTTAGGEGDTVRNITGCPVAGIDPDERFDVRPVIEAAARFFYGNRDYSDLPRKHKYTITACPAQCSAPEIHDVALVGTVRDGRPGFGLRVGGGLSNTPRLARDLGVFVPIDDAIPVLRAVTDAWRTDLRYRVSRAKARIKFMVDDLGPEGMRARVEERLGRRLEDGQAPPPEGEPEHLGLRRQRQERLVYLGVPVPAGRVSGTQLEGLADLIEPMGADVRLTRQQNLIVGNVPEDRLPELRDGLARLGLDPDVGDAYARSVACTSHRFCNYSVAETKEKLVEVLAHLQARFGAERVAGLRIHMDGCPHACAQHWIGEIGLQGTTAPSRDGSRRVEAYDLTLGGGLGTRAGIGRSILRRIPAGELEGVLERLIEAWIAQGQDVSFGAFCDARTDEELARIAAGAPPAVEEAASGPVVRIPGVLLPLTDGADRIEVPAATVGEALAEVARRHPRFGEAVLVGGGVAEAYLVVVNEEDVRGLDGLATRVGPGDEITVLVAMAGGAR